MIRPRARSLHWLSYPYCCSGKKENEFLFQIIFTLMANTEFHKNLLNIVGARMRWLSKIRLLSVLCTSCERHTKTNSKIRLFIFLFFVLSAKDTQKHISICNSLPACHSLILKHWPSIFVEIVWSWTFQLWEFIFATPYPSLLSFTG
jgi:hypothetical protein